MKSMDELVDIVRMLRSENGCAWDRKQTHESLRPCIMEEAAELLAAIRIYGECGNPENMQEELGDILLQVVMHAQLANEEGLFDLNDVTKTISEKMIRRHPHVFVDKQQSGIDTILSNWEQIKQKEKEGKAWVKSPLREIPYELPALTRASKVMKKADMLYGRTKSITENMEEAKAAMRELEQLSPDADQEKAAERIGDILMNLSDISRKFKLSQEQILTDKIENFIVELEPG